MRINDAPVREGEGEREGEKERERKREKEREKEREGGKGKEGKRRRIVSSSVFLSHEGFEQTFLNAVFDGWYTLFETSPVCDASICHRHVQIDAHQHLATTQVHLTHKTEKRREDEEGERETETER